MSRHHHNSNLALNDLLFNVLVGFVFLFVLAFLLINPVAKQGDIPTKAEFIIQISWGEDRVDDVDLWVQRDNEKPVSYKDKISGEMHLERDDLGTKNDIVMVDGRTTILRFNGETVTIRGIIPGNYYVGLHYYDPMRAVLAYEDNKNPGDFSGGPVTVETSIIKVNPYRLVYQGTSTLVKKGDKINVIGFTVDSKGLVTQQFSHSKNLGPQLSSSASGNSPGYYNYN